MESDPNTFPPCSHRAYLPAPPMAGFDCVRCGVEVGPSALLCPACYAKTRTARRLAPQLAVCPGCGGRLTAGKCGWC